MVKKIVVIGWGNHSGSWIARINTHPDWELNGIVDIDTEKVGNIPKVLCNPDNGFVTLQDLVNMGEKPDVVLITTPIPTHHTLAIDALDLGIHVICEKNMAYTLQQGKQMVKTALRHPNLCTAVGTQYRYLPQFWALKAFLETNQNAVGNWGLINVELAGGGENPKDREGWRRDMEDIYLQDMAPHYIDLIRYWTGMDFVEMSAKAFIPNYSGWKGTSGVFMNFALAKPEDYYNQDAWVWGRFYGDWQKKGPGLSRFELIGKNGTVLCTDYTNWKYLPGNPSGSIKNEVDIIPRKDVFHNTQNLEGHSFFLEDFSKAIDSQGKIKPMTHFEEAFKSFAAIMAAKESSMTGKTVFVPDLWKNLL
jgi:predicted dehydrogenase